MSNTDRVLSELFDRMLYHQSTPVNIFILPKFKNIPPKTLAQTVWRLKQKGYIKKIGDGFAISANGQKYFKRNPTSLTSFTKPKDATKEKILLVFFDIPNSQKKQRDWFRTHLKKFDYEMIQRSVWVGPDPLPAEFLSYAEKIGLENCIEAIRLAQPYRAPKKNTSSVGSYFAKIKNMI